MQDEHRHLLRKHRMALSRDLDAKTVASHLYSKGVISENEKEEIQTQKTNQEKSEMLLDKIARKGPNAFDILCDILKEVQPHLEQLLRPVQPKDDGTTAAVDAAPRRPDSHDGVQKTPISASEGDETAGMKHLSLSGDQADAGILTFGKGSSGSRSPLSDSESTKYHMDKKPRGIALIINNKNFKRSSGMEKYPRNGTDRDRDALIEVYKMLKFDVKPFNDQTTNQIERLLKELSSGNHSSYDAVAVAILSHGEEGIIYSTDGKMDLRSISEPFRGPNLAGKPKIFVFQACQGHEYMDGHDATDGPNRSDTVKVPLEADFIYAYSTVPGYYSWRNSVNGSWFIQSLAEIFKKHAHDMDIMRMLTRVNGNVAKFKSRTSDYYSDNKMQVSTVVSTLRKELYFFPENVKDN